jgi:hypothetical protein
MILNPGTYTVIAHIRWYTYNNKYKYDMAGEPAHPPTTLPCCW